jgi:hypothetical protein
MATALADGSALPVFGLACLATLVGLLASVLASRWASGRRVTQAITAGVLLGLLADILLRLTAAAGVSTSLLVKAAPSSLRGPVATAGPYAIEGLAAALLLVTFAVSIQAGRSSMSAGAGVVLLTLGVGVYEFVQGLVAGARSDALSSGLGPELLGGLALMQASRGIAIGGAVLVAEVGIGWLALAAVVLGPLGLIGAAAGKALSFETSGTLAAPLLVLASVVLVLLLTRLLRQATEPAERGPGQVGGFLVGLLATLTALRLVSPL